MSIITIKYSYLTLPYLIFRVERFKERLNIKIVKKVNGSDDGVDDKSALLSDYKYDNSTSKECNDIMKGMERSPVTGSYTFYLVRNIYAQTRLRFFTYFQLQYFNFSFFLAAAKALDTRKNIVYSTDRCNSSIDANGEHEFFSFPRGAEII